MKECAGKENSSEDSENVSEEPLWFLYDSLVTVLVGPDEQRFDVHKALLCKSSDFFNAALNGNFIEANGTVKLPEQNPGVFKYFVHWLYTGSLRGFYYSKTAKPTIQDLTSAVKAEVDRQWREHRDQLAPSNPHRQAWELANYQDVPLASLVALYILADALQVNKLGDVITLTLIHVYGHTTLDPPNRGGYRIFWTKSIPDGLVGPATGVNLAYQKLPQTSNLCRLLLHLFADSSHDTVWHSSRDPPLDPSFVILLGEELGKRWVDNRDPSKWDIYNICQYHEHEASTCTLTEAYLDSKFFSSILD